MKKEKQLQRLNKSIAKGQVKYSLHFALALLTGFAIAKLFTGNAIYWILMEGWVSFTIIFMLSYFFLWKINIKKAKEIVDELGTGEVASPPSSNTGSWIAVFIIALLLLSPSIFKKQIIEWAVKTHKTTATNIGSPSEDGNGPKYYIVK